MLSEKKINIFIVDDNKTFSLALKADIEVSFNKMPIKIHSFETGEKCMEKFMQIVPDLVILDYNLSSKHPEAVDGIKVLDWIKQENHRTKVIMLTSDDNIDIALKSFHHGAEDYVVKTESKFKKINNSLFNMFKMLEASREARTYKHLFLALSLFIALLIGGILAIQFFMQDSLH